MFISNTATKAGGYTISRSVRLRSSASANFSKTFSSAPTSKTKQTIAVWCKRGVLSSEQDIIAGYDGVSAGGTRLDFLSSNAIEFKFGTSSNLVTTAVYRDPSAWYNIVAVIDTTQATASNRLLLYVNGVQVTSFSTANYPNLNDNSQFVLNNSNNRIGSQDNNANYFDGYITEMYFIDGQALTPSSFGSTNAITGVWQPAKYTGTYGTNGFYLNFSSNGTAAALGTDFSGNSNTWTVNNISVTAGATYDSMTDVPTLTSATAANYAVMNPLDKNTQVTTADGNLSVSWSGSSGHSVRNTFGMTTGKWYCEMVAGGTGSCFGIATAAANLIWPGNDANGYGYRGDLGQLMYNGSATVTGMSTFTSNDVIGMAFDADNGKIWFSKNGTWYNSGDPAAGTNATKTGIAAGTWFVMIGYITTTSTAYFNAGQRPFTYTPPSGYVALNTYNLPASTISNGATVMAASLYTGTNANLTVTNTVNGVGFKPDFAWIKIRSTTSDHVLIDSVRGVQQVLWSDLTNAEATSTSTSGLLSFASNGLNLGTNISTTGSTNGVGGTYVAWQWQAGQGSTSSNTNGSITSTVSVNATAGFSVVTYTGTLSGTPGTMPTVGHGLGVAPKLIISKSRNVTGVDSGAWFVWSANTGSTDYYLRLNTTAAVASVSGGGGGTMVAPTSTVFSTPYISGANINANNYVAYCWSEVAGFSKFGSYTGNGSADGPFVYTGFRPRLVMVKASSAIEGWVIWDSSRDTYNVMPDVLYPNGSNAEVGNTQIDFLSNGFKLRNTTTNGNISGTTYIYSAYAENPFRNALAR